VKPGKSHYLGAEQKQVHIPARRNKIQARGKVMMRLPATASPVLISIDFARLLQALRVFWTHFQRTTEHSIALQLATEGFSNGLYQHESRPTDTTDTSWFSLEEIYMIFAQEQRCYWKSGRGLQKTKRRLGMLATKRSK